MPDLPNKKLRTFWGDRFIKQNTYSNHFSIQRNSEMLRLEFKGARQALSEKDVTLLHLGY